MFKVIVFVPTEAKELVKEAMFASGGGALGHYSQCSFESRGEGQFRPGENSQPFFGDRGELKTVEEYKVEMLVASEKITDVLRAMIKAHPYEEVAYDVFKQAEIIF